MRRERSIFKFLILSMILIIIAIILIISLITRRVKSVRENQFAREMSKISEELEKSDTASTQIGKTVENAEKELNEDKEEIYKDPEMSVEELQKEKDEESISETDNKNDTDNITKQTNASIVKKEKNKEKKKIEVTKEKPKEEDISFETPLKGEILKEFARDTLIYSNTLQEWVTHNGIDIKADKTSVVKSAAKGHVSAIKNDPRYGLTVIITHDNGYQTVYSNLLTSEFVVKGEDVEAGQSIGTVGNSASFELADEYHLHFELLKNNEYVDPTIYINFE